MFLSFFFCIERKTKRPPSDLISSFSVAGMAALEGDLEECLICMEEVPRSDISPLAHAGGTASSVRPRGATGFSDQVRPGRSEHKQVRRRNKLLTNQPCPWCRDEVVWNQVFGFLDTLKGKVGKAANPDQLADLMAQWEIYEMTRSNSDVLLFARDMVQDRGLAVHLDKAIESNASWLRDSIGLWCRFLGMIVDDKLSLLDASAGERIRMAVEAGLASFDANGGNARTWRGLLRSCVLLCCARRTMPWARKR